MNDVSPDATREKRAGESAAARAAPLVKALLESGAGRGGASELLDALVDTLRSTSLPIARATLHLRQLHPEIAARSLLWEEESGKATEMGHAYATQTSAIYLESPVRLVFEQSRTIRRRLDDPARPPDYEILRELQAKGFTDYVIGPLPVAGGLPSGLSLATRRKGGFSAAELALVAEVLPAFGALLALVEERRTARALLETYLGRGTGERILKGAVRRGSGETIHAVLLFADLSSFTRISEALPLPKVIALLNDFFDCLAEPITANRGEILKFVGDGLLAIFPCEDVDGAVCQAADRAIAAARAASAAVCALKPEGCEAVVPNLDCCVAVHVGEVMYGNIGAADRLDFTVIGPAVNLVSRLEGLCAALETKILVSEAIVRASRHDYRSLGRHRVKGMAEPIEVFTPFEAE